MRGFLILNKPVGMTSREAVDRAKRLCKPAKTGHTGTLDPIASGVLVISIGEATRLTEYVQKMSKRYLATFLLGCRSETDDTEQGYQELPDAPQPDLDTITQLLPEFLGKIAQIPPAFSAVKIKGKRAYKMARRGEQVEIQPREVSIYQLKIVSYNYPELVVDVSCGGGTYIRALGRDIASRLETSAVMSQLTRQEVGQFHLRDALDLESLNSATLREHLLPMTTAIGDLTDLSLSQVEIQQLHQGKAIANRFAITEAESEFAGLDPRGNLATILRYDAVEQVIRPIRNFSSDL